MSAPTGILKVIERVNRTRRLPELRISGAYLSEMGVGPGDYVEVVVGKGNIIILRRAPAPSYQERAQRNRMANGHDKRRARAR